MAEAKPKKQETQVFECVETFSNPIVGSYAQGDVFGGRYTDDAKKVLDELVKEKVIKKA